MNTALTPDPSELAAWVRDARNRTLALVADLTDEQMRGPLLAIVNPLWWEIGHVAWFQERWGLRRAGAPSLCPAADALYDSARIPHDDRWELPLPSRAETLEYLRRVCDAALHQLQTGEPTPEDIYFHSLAVFHEDMHTEAFTYTRQTLAYPAPRLGGDGSQLTAHSDEAAHGARRTAHGGKAAHGSPLTAHGSDPDRLYREPCTVSREPSSPGDASIPGGTWMLGATPDMPFVFDNEKWAHPVEVAPFRIARAAVTNAEYTAFVQEGGYQRREWWSEEGWRWRCESAAEGPLYWQRAGSDGWQRRVFDRWAPLEPDLPVLHVNWHEAQAYSRFAGRRLPTEAEWELAASGEPTADGRGITARKRRYPWGDEPPSPARANLDWAAGGCLPVSALPDGDSAFGCRQMIGNVWEWTESPFLPYPGFVIDPYKEYSEPWFGTRKVLRGGCWATRSRLIRNTWRNFYTPDRRDVWAGFRTCAR
jgi:iron(II)-dependent oxidoreductase